MTEDAPAGPLQGVAAVVVTRDRRELLWQSLTAVCGQTRPAERVIVVDNASSDGTGQMLRERFPDVQVVRLEHNSGATGGFDEGIKAGCAAGARWLWLLDDDSFPRPDCLQTLLEAHGRGVTEPELLASRMEWRDGNPHPMNRPTIRRRDPVQLYGAAAVGLLPLRATTWVSLLLSTRAVARCGGPDRSFFYQADDIEYTARILRQGAGYFVPESVVEHRTPDRQTGTSDAHRFYHHARNTLWMLRGQAWEPREKPALAWALLRSAAEYLRAHRFATESVLTLARASADGLRSR